jgi:serpin B
MHMNAELALGQAAGGLLLELPYSGRDLSMLFLLPDAMEGLPALEQVLTPANLDLWRGTLHTSEINVYLPRFTVTSSFSLKETLSALGMPVAFSDAADFSGMNGTGGLTITDALHKAFVINGRAPRPPRPPALSWARRARRPSSWPTTPSSS